MKCVRGLTNAITVSNRAAPVGDLQANIEAALSRRYDADDQSAWSAPGVEDVRDYMRIAD